MNDETLLAQVEFQSEGLTDTGNFGAATSGSGLVQGGDCQSVIDLRCISSLELDGMLPLIAAYAFLFAAVLSVFFVFWGGISFILSGGEDEQIKKSVNTIRYALVGFVVSVFSLFIVFLIGRFLGIPLDDFLTYQKIIDTIKQMGPATRATTSEDFQIIP